MYRLHWKIQSKIHKSIFFILSFFCAPKYYKIPIFSIPDIIIIGKIVHFLETKWYDMFYVVDSVIISSSLSSILIQSNQVFGNLFFHLSLNSNKVKNVLRFLFIVLHYKMKNSNTTLIFLDVFDKDGMLITMVSKRVERIEIYENYMMILFSVGFHIDQ